MEFCYSEFQRLRQVLTDCPIQHLVSTSQCLIIIRKKVTDMFNYFTYSFWVHVSPERIRTSGFSAAHQQTRCWSKAQILQVREPWKQIIFMSWFDLFLNFDTTHSKFLGHFALILNLMFYSEWANKSLINSYFSGACWKPATMLL